LIPTAEKLSHPAVTCRLPHSDESADRDVTPLSDRELDALHASGQAFNRLLGRRGGSGRRCLVGCHRFRELRRELRIATGCNGNKCFVAVAVARELDDLAVEGAIGRDVRRHGRR